MPKITLHEGPSYDPYKYPAEQTTSGPQITETDNKEVADADEKIEYVAEEGDESSVGNSSETSFVKTEKTKKKVDPKPSLFARGAQEPTEK